MNLDEKLLEIFNNQHNLKSSEFLRKKSSVLMLSGGVDSVSLLKRILLETDELIYAHHVHIKNNEGMEFERYKKESEAVRKIVPYMKKTFRNFNYTESTINIKQIMDLLPNYYEEEDFPLIPLTFVLDSLFWGLMSGIISRITNSNKIYVGTCLEDNIGIRFPGYDEFSTENQHKFIRSPALSAASYPHEIPSLVRAPTHLPWDEDTTDDNALTKRQSIEYIGEELMNMVWYCRSPIEKDGEFVVCHECKSCRHVDDALSEKK